MYETRRLPHRTTPYIKSLPLIFLKQGMSSDFCRSLPKLMEWLKVRVDSPRRVLFGPMKGNNYSYVAWVPFGGHICSIGAPKSVQELVDSANTLYTNIRMVALGVDETYIMIWEDGKIRWDLKEH